MKAMDTPLKTLFLNPPSFEKFDGGASSRWPATREIESYWYPVWLTYPAGMLEGSRLVDAPPHQSRNVGSCTMFPSQSAPRVPAPRTSTPAKSVRESAVRVFVEVFTGLLQGEGGGRG